VLPVSGRTCHNPADKAQAKAVDHRGVLYSMFEGGGIKQRAGTRCATRV
jgi:hypothetical protein